MEGQALYFKARRARCDRLLIFSPWYLFGQDNTKKQDTVGVPAIKQVKNKYEMPRAIQIALGVIFSTVPTNS